MIHSFKLEKYKDLNKYKSIGEKSPKTNGAKEFPLTEGGLFQISYFHKLFIMNYENDCFTKAVIAFESFITCGYLYLVVIKK